MAQASLSSIVRHCNQLLAHARIPDYDGAHNGLQVENDGHVTRVAAAVDASLATVRRAVSLKATLLMVHHGLFWTNPVPWTGARRELMRLLIENNLAVYSSHLPLDAHPRLGNNALLCHALGITRLKRFFPYKETAIGWMGTISITRERLAERLEALTGSRVRCVPGGPNRCRRIGVVTGGAGAQLQAAADARCDTFITGEGPHWTYALAEELGLNVLYAGHYATETFGVKALAAHVSKTFKLPWVFIDYPTGL